MCNASPTSSETLRRFVGSSTSGPGERRVGKIERPSVESLIMDFAMSLTRRATCKRAQFSCVITSEDMTQIYGFGYNGTAKGFSHDDCKADLPGGCGCVHAEQNALIKVRVNDPRKVVFVTGQPCITCAKRSEERRVGKECRTREAPQPYRCHDVGVRRS